MPASAATHSTSCDFAKILGPQAASLDQALAMSEGWIHDRRACLAWAEVVLQADCPEAVEALREVASRHDAFNNFPVWMDDWKKIGAHGWRKNLPVLATYHVDARGIKAGRYQRQFPNAKAGWQRLVEQRHLSPFAYTDRFGSDLSLAAAWVGRGLWPASILASQLRQAPPEAIDALRQTGLGSEVILSRVPRAQRLGWAEKMLLSETAPSQTWLQQHPEIAHVAQTMAMDGRITTATLLSWVPRPAADVMAALVLQDRVTLWEQLQAGCLPASQVQSQVAQGHWSAREVVGVAGIPSALVVRWLDEGRLTEDEYLQASVACWQPLDLLPAVQQEQAVNAWGSYLLLRTMTLPQKLSTRQSFALRMLACRWLTHEGSQPLEEPASGKPADAPTDCIVCLEPFSPERPAVRPLACDHPANTCGPCLQRVAAPGGTASCPADYRKLHPDDVLRCGGNAAQADALAKTILRRARAHPAWASCPTTDCAGGTLNYLSQGHMVTCRVCDIKYRVAIPEFDLRRDGTRLLMLIDSMQARGQATQQPARPCYHCGAETEHTGGCAHMHCAICGEDWHWSRGAYRAGDYGGVDEAMRYVPYAGSMLRTGIFNGLAPGQTDIADLHEQALANATRMGLFANERQPDAPARPRRPALLMAPPGV